MLRWALRRQGPDAPPLRLASRRIYIVPTRTGLVFGLLLVAMFLAGMNYGNGLALLLAFWLASFALVGMVQTQRGLAGLSMLEAQVEPAFAGGEILLTLSLQARLAPADLEFRAEQVLVKSTRASPAVVPDVQAVTLEFPVSRRGSWRCPVLRLSTVAPYGLFRTWTWLALDLRTQVYPKPEGTLPVPESPGADAGTRRMAGSLDEIAGLRPFREGDSPRQVAWKAYARGAALLVREYQGNASARREFDFDTLPLAGTEARLSQLARWVVDAASQNQGWVLHLPGAAPLAGAGIEHRCACLTRLALFAPEPAP
jgi:uncharacterized protein (DUF58 family)